MNTMKRFLIIALIVSMFACMSVACAEDLEVQVIGGENQAATPISLDDMKLGTSYTLDGYAIVKPIEYLLVDCFAQFGENENYIAEWGGYSYNPSFDTVFSYSDSKCDYNAMRYKDAGWMDSGSNAQFVWLRTDVTNLSKSDVSFDEEATVKVIYQDEYEFNGWVRQINYDNIDLEHGDGSVCRYTFDKSMYPPQIVMNPAKNTPVSMMYTGNYVFGCTIPNYVCEDKQSPLRIEIKLGDNELTYHIRK